MIDRKMRFKGALPGAGNEGPEMETRRSRTHHPALRVDGVVANQSGESHAHK